MKKILKMFIVLVLMISVPTVEYVARYYVSGDFAFMLGLILGGIIMTVISLIFFDKKDVK